VAVGDGIGEGVVVTVGVAVMVGAAVAVTVGASMLAGVSRTVAWATAVTPVAIMPVSGCAGAGDMPSFMIGPGEQPINTPLRRMTKTLIYVLVDITKPLVVSVYGEGNAMQFGTVA
jgi:hypothetical protein